MTAVRSGTLFPMTVRKPPQSGGENATMRAAEPSGRPHFWPGNNQWARALLRHDFEEVDFETQQTLSLDRRARRFHIVGQIWRYKQLPFLTHVHLLQSLSPARDDSLNEECLGTTLRLRAVEFSAVQQCAAIVTA